MNKSILQYIFCCVPQRKKVIQVWNGIVNDDRILEFANSMKVIVFKIVLHPVGVGLCVHQVQNRQDRVRGIKHTILWTATHSIELDQQLSTGGSKHCSDRADINILKQ